MHVAAADTAGGNPDQYFIGSRNWGRQVSDFEMTVLREQ
jgi:hypothetical protein